MRQARGLRISSSHDVCVFCATRQLAANVSPALSQRRLLNSSTKAPQYATEQVFKEQSEQPRRLTLAERFQQQQQATLARQQPPPPPVHPPIQRANAHPQGSSRYQPQQQRYPSRNPPSSLFDEPRRHPQNDAFAPRRENRFGDSPRQNQYNVNMDSRPPMRETSFGSGEHLRRRNQPPVRGGFPASNAQSQGGFQNPRHPAGRGRLDQNELDRLLGNRPTQSEESSKSYAPLTERKQVKCFICRSTEHWSADCPNQSREPPKAYAPLTERKQVKCFVCKSTEHWSADCPNQSRNGKVQATGSLADAANDWARKATLNTEQRTVIPPQDEDGRGRRGAETSDRRRSRFAMDEEEAPGEIRNRYENPKGRGRMGERRAYNNRRTMRVREEEDDAPRMSKEERRRIKEAKKAAQLAKSGPTPIYLPEYISVANLATMLKLRVEDFVRKLEELGFEDVQTDHILNAEHAGLVAQEYNREPIVQAEGEDNDLYPAAPLSPEEYAELPQRPPVVTIMGHVDHGKTTILDYMRQSSVAATEFGGITQHIGAFSVPLKSGGTITYLDTPGHAAFETMRARGANVTDIVVLVVAADDSVMPQTVEAIKHAQAARVPIIVAINKIDKNQADPERVKSDLGRHGLEVEDFGGDIQTVNVSGKTGQGIPDLEDAISLQSEMLDHRADPTASIEGWVLEGKTTDRGRVATILVRSGTLRQGDVLVAGTTWARVRTLRNEAGAIVQEVGPGMPVEVDGWREQPIAGDEVLQAADEQQASSVSDLRVEKVERERMAKDMEAINEFRRVESERREAEEAAAKAAKNGEEVVQEEVKVESGPEIISFIIKGDVSGSVEAVMDSISAIGNGEVGTRILRHGVGPPSEFDVQHAADAKGHIVNFNTSIPSHIASMAEQAGVKILDSNIIYRVVEDVKALLSEKLAPKITQRVTGEAEIAAIFDIGIGGKKKLRVAGSKVRNGAMKKLSMVKVLRGEEIVHTGTITSLKNVKKDVDEMRKDTECGIAFNGWEDFQVGDKVQCYDETSEKRYL